MSPERRAEIEQLQKDLALFGVESAEAIRDCLREIDDVRKATARHCFWLARSHSRAASNAIDAYLGGLLDAEDQREDAVQVDSNGTGSSAEGHHPQTNGPAQPSSHLHDLIRDAINRSCGENGSDTPDFILADYMLDCLNTFDRAVNARENWYGSSKESAAAQANITERS